jgi:5,10-methylenetetrahydrofolate reductase
VNVALEFLDAVSHIKAALLIGIFPPRSYKQAEYFAKYVPGVQVPEEFLKTFEGLANFQIRTSGGGKLTSTILNISQTSSKN